MNVIWGGLKKYRKLLFSISFLLWCCVSGVFAQPAQRQKTAVDQVNVFLGTSGDHGQLSPAASFPFSMMSICPQTYPSIHTGYEYAAKQYKGFVHTIMEGVGCQGSGGNILIKPFIHAASDQLIKTSQQAAPGFYQVGFSNGIKASFTVSEKSGMHFYQFPGNENGFLIDLSHTLSNGFVGEAHQTGDSSVSGWVEARTTCGAGKYRLYYFLSFNGAMKFVQDSEHKFLAYPVKPSQKVEIKIALSSVNEAYAKSNISTASFAGMRQQAVIAWEKELGHIKVIGDKERVKLFYSLLYRTMQSPFLISEADGKYKATNGSIQTSNRKRYNGWAIWDNYRTQLPLLSILDTARYQDITHSISDLYRFGKKSYATANEPSNTVRTEHAMVVLLDGMRKGYLVNFNAIKDSLIKEANALLVDKPDKALESCYDFWALAEMLQLNGDTAMAAGYYAKAKEYAVFWKKEFSDLGKKDVDQMGARGMYQGTVWQYRWFVPYDSKGLIDLAGGDKAFVDQLDYFFDHDLYNHANEPDLQVPSMYNASSEPWKSQRLMHAYAVDTVVQYYFNDNSKGIDPFVDRIYKNEPKSYIRTMDDDAGAMSSWFVLTACGITPACVGWPVYYLHVPLFPHIVFNKLKIAVVNFNDQHPYIAKVVLNGKELNRNYLLQEEITAGGTLVITASASPVRGYAKEKWVSELK
ncbi:MAG: glycoside hydrolase domain-containing protein [Bacteroidota bacterium]